MHVDLPPLVSVEATAVCIPIANQEILLADVYKSPGRTWNEADVTEVLSFRHKCILAGGLNAKHPSRNSAICNCLIQFISKFNRHNIVVHKNIRLSDVIVSDILDSDHLPIIFHILNHIRTKQISKQLEKFADRERFKA
jgi:hypothetical protein